MVHIRLDDNCLELSMGWECPTTGGNPAVVSTEAPTLATLEVVAAGDSRKLSDSLRAPLACIGHGHHSNVVAADDRDSGSRAGIHRRESGWFDGDMGSTNGICLAGERSPGDRALNPDTAVRFRGAKVIFRSEPEFVDADGATDLLVKQDC